MPTSQKIHITERQFKTIIMFSVIGDSILVLPSFLGASAQQDAWIAMLAALAGGMLVGWLYAALGNRQQGRSLIGAAIALGGKWFGGLLGLVYVFFFYVLVLSQLSSLSLFMTTHLMLETPSEAIVLGFLVVLTAALRYGEESFTRMSELLFPIFMSMFLFLVLCLLPQIDIHKLTPVMSFGFLPVMKGTYQAFGFGFLESLALLMLIPYIDNDRKVVRRAIFNGFFTGGVVLFLVMLLCVLVIGPDMMKEKLYPTFVLAQRIEIGGFLERTEALLAFLWIVSVFFKSLLCSFAMTKGLGEIFRLQNDQILAMPVALLLLAGSQINVPNVARYIELFNEAPQYDVAGFLLLPLAQFLLLGIPAVKRRLQNKAPNNQAAGQTNGTG